jgi:hypothetical protein
MANRLRRVGLLFVLVLALALPFAGRAGACPFCDGGPSGPNEVKEAVFGPDFWPNVLAMALPFLVVGAVVAGIHFLPQGGADERPH